MLELMETKSKASGPVDGARGRFLAFLLGGEVFAMDIRSVKEVIQYGGITTVPLMPGAIRGVINLRGAVVPVIDLSVRFGRPPTEIHRRTCAVILELDQEDGPAVLGILVDQVREVLEIASTEMEPVPAFGGGIPPGCLSAVGKVAGEFVLILDVDHALSLRELSEEGAEWTGRVQR